ncbi:MAG: efflux RND transporter periplasmic adaptor subunit [Burkholderiales bacterium]|nr:efflux RND transporter periplasmic adaptor subunit [Burkholderiales bacterium]
MQTKKILRFAPRRLPLLAMLTVVLAGAGWTLYSKNTTAQAKPADNNVREVVFELAAADISRAETRELALRLPLSGTLVPVAQATVRSKVAAEVADTLVQEGMAVKKGQVIARFAAADLQARLTTQDAAVDEAKARLSLAQKNRLSNETLLKQNYISQNAFDTTHNNLELARASLKSAVSQREVAQLAVADTEVKSPMDGIVSKRSVQPGDKVSPDTPLFTIVNLAQLTLEAQVPASEIPRVKTGQNVSFHVDGFGGRQFSGKLVRINPSAEAGSRYMLVYVAVDNADAALKGGMFAKGSLVLEKSAAVTVVPLSALRQQNGAELVYQIVNGQVRAQTVKLGMRDEEEGVAQILQGLEAGATVLSARLDNVRSGSKVSLPTNTATPAGASAPAAKG